MSLRVEIMELSHCFRACIRTTQVVPLLLLAACGAQPGWPSDDASSAVSAGGARELAPLAPSLSLMAATAPAGDNAYEQAVGCVASLDVFAETVTRLGMTGEAELGQLRQAVAKLRSRLPQLAAGAGETSSQAQARLATARDKADENQASTARAAVACLRGLATETS